ncbi:MAG: hypothetical protein HRU14_11665 [Planctomycetes bacterium]|nr:hypothetical protein [Planctomycetota bacterium]
MIRSLVCLIPLALSSCSCPPQPDLKRYGEWDFKTPKACLEYFRLALERREAYHIRLCLSDDLVAREGLDVSKLHTFMEEVISKLEAQVGRIEDIEIDRTAYRPGRPWLANVRVFAGNRGEMVYLVLQTTAWATFRDGRPPVAVKLSPNETLATAAAREPLLGSADVYRLEYEKGWRILGISNTDIGAEMEEYLRELENKK